MAVFLVLLLFATWSFAFPIGKYMLAFSPPIFLTGFRMVLGGVILLGYLFFKKQIPKVTARQAISLILLAFFSIYLTNILEFWSLGHLSAVKTCFIYSLSPFIAAFLSFLHFKEKMTPLKWLGMIVGCFGFIPAMMTKTGTEELFGAFIGLTWPEIAMAGAAFFSVYGWVILRLVVKNEEISPFFANGSSMFIGGVLALITSLFIDTWAPVPIAKGGFLPLVLSVSLLTLFSNIFCYNLYGYLLKRFTATLMSFFGLLSPLFASISSWIVLHEPPSLPILLSSGIVILGLWIVYKEELRQGYLIKSEA